MKIYNKMQIYHVYNRGVRKEPIFHDHQDFTFFLKKLNESAIKYNFKIICYCIMPNHYHICLKQMSTEGLDRLMRSLATSYAMFYNNKYKTVGHVFQGRFKYRDVIDEKYLFYLSLYIHNNPYELSNQNPQNYKYSSVKEFISCVGNQHRICDITEIIKDNKEANDYKIILGSFKNKKQHQNNYELFKK